MAVDILALSRIAANKDFKDESKVDTSKCLAKMTGIKYDLIAHDNITRWYNDGIIATSRIYDYFTDNCEESSGSLFYYHETEGYNKLLSLTNKIADEKEQKKTNIKASKLTDF